jgi:hypothetical protein
MKPNLVEALELSLQILKRGGTVEECLVRFPSLEAELRPLLESAQVARSLNLPSVPEKAITRGRVRVLNRAAQLRQGNQPPVRFPRAWRMATITLLVLAFLFFTGNGAIAVSANSLPGDAFYPVKRAVEDVRLWMAPDIKAKAEIQKEISTSRIDETEKLLSRQRVETVEFTGQVGNQLPEGWLIAGIPVRVTGQTAVEGAFTVGALAEVRGKTQTDGSVLAELVNVKPGDVENKDDQPGPSGGADKTPEATLPDDDDSSGRGRNDTFKTPEPTKPDNTPTGPGDDNGEKTPEPKETDDDPPDEGKDDGDDDSDVGTPTPEPPDDKDNDDGNND